MRENTGDLELQVLEVLIVGRTGRYYVDDVYGVQKRSV